MTLEIIDMEIKDTTLSGRTKNCCQYAGIRTVGVLMRLEAWELLRIPNMGRKSVEEIIKFFGQYGYELQGQDKFYKQKKQLPWVVKLIEEAVAQERDACARVCEDLMLRENPYERWEGMKWCVERIRARGKA